jgi:integrase
MANKKTPGLVKRGQIWHIDKRIGQKRIQSSTETGCREDAEAILSHVISTHHRAKFFGVRPKRLFREAATKFLTEETKKSLHNDAQALRILDPFIGDLYLEQVHGGTLEPFVLHMRHKGRSAGTTNRYLAVVRRILNLAARYWRDVETGLSWLEAAPLFRLEKGHKRKPYPISWEEQKLLLSELAPDLVRMALFLINTGVRDQELCSLRWSWQQGDDLFELPEQYSKNGLERFVVLNSVAQSVLKKQIGKDQFRVFPRARVYGKGWRNARVRAADRYEAELGMECPWGFRHLRIHDLRHTFGRRVRAAGWSNEDRKDLLGHKNGDITTHYSRVEIDHLREVVESITKKISYNSPTLRVVGD